MFASMGVLTKHGQIKYTFQVLWQGNKEAFVCEFYESTDAVSTTEITKHTDTTEAILM